VRGKLPGSSPQLKTQPGTSGKKFLYSFATFLISKFGHLFSNFFGGFTLHAARYHTHG
jgi:hypothetical protein